MESKSKKKFKFPNSLLVLFILICFVTLLTYIVPAGKFGTMVNASTGVEMVDATAFNPVDQSPVSLFRLFVAIPEGFINGASIIFLIIFGYFWVFSVVSSGALTAAINKLLNSKAKDSKLFIPIIFLIFALAGSTYGEFETIYGLLPIFVALAIALGYDAIVGMCMSGMAVAVGFASATTNPFTIGIAQSYGELPIFSGLGLRWVVFFAFYLISVATVMRYAAMIKKDPSKSVVADCDFSSFKLDTQSAASQNFTGTHKLLLLGMVATVATIVIGSLKLGWYLNEMSGIFIISGILSQLIAKKTPEQIAQNLVTACSEMAIAVMVVGFSRTILVILQSGSIIDSIIYALYLPMQNAPAWLVGELMLVAQNILNFFIPSGSGQATAIMPIMIPLADLAGLNRQIAVLAYQFGDGFSNLIWPTGACAIMCGVTKVPIGKWYKFFLPVFGLMFVAQTIFIIIAVMINYGPF